MGGGGTGEEWTGEEGKGARGRKRRMKRIGEDGDNVEDGGGWGDGEGGG